MSSHLSQNHRSIKTLFLKVLSALKTQGNSPTPLQAPIKQIVESFEAIRDITTNHPNFLDKEQPDYWLLLLSTQ